MNPKNFLQGRELWSWEPDFDEDYDEDGEWSAKKFIKEFNTDFDEDKKVPKLNIEKIALTPRNRRFVKDVYEIVNPFPETDPDSEENENTESTETVFQKLKVLNNLNAELSKKGGAWNGELRTAVEDFIELLDEPQLFLNTFQSVFAGNLRTAGSVPSYAQGGLVRGISDAATAGRVAGENLKESIRRQQRLDSDSTGVNLRKDFRRTQELDAEEFIRKTLWDDGLEESLPESLNDDPENLVLGMLDRKIEF